MKPKRLLGLSASLLLVAGTAGAQTTVFNPGVLRQQWWTSTNPTRQQVEQGTAGAPDTDTIDLTACEIPPTSPNIDNFVNRISGLFVAPATTNYVFFYSSDDDGDFFLSTDATALNKRIVCQETSWGNFDEWVSNGGGAAALPNKRSDQYSPDAGNTVPFKNGIPLVAGQKYWIESVHHEGGGGDNCGATFKYVGEPDPTNGEPSRMTGSLIGYGYTIPASLTVQVDATNATAIDGREASFTYVVADPLPDPLVYQWYKNGTAISNANYKQYTFSAATADNNAQFQCVVTLPASYNSSLSSTSAVATLTVNGGSVTYTNGLKVEGFFGAGRVQVENGETGPANLIALSRNGAESTVNDGINNYTRKMSGWYIPPADGSYVFFLSSDDDADLFLSTDASPSNKQLIAQENVWSNSREWISSGGASELGQKRSDQWTNGSGTAPYPTGIPLKGGTPYYIEAVSHQGGGGDNVGVLAQIAGSPDPTNGAPPIPPEQLSLKTSVATTLTWTNQPKDTTVFDASQAIFRSGAVSDSEFNPQYQWQRSGTNIPGATASSYSFTAVVADNGTKFDVVASTAEGGLSITSSVATLTVQQAVFEPGLALMQYWLNQGADLTIPESGAFGPPDFVMAVPAFECGNNNENGNTYVNEISGFFVPATSGAYDFICNSDDHCDFFISTDSNPNNKRLVCQQPGWSNALTWTSDNGGGTDAQQKNSATWQNSSGATPFGAGINLTAGQKYYIEVWHQEGGGGDNVGVTAVPHGGSQADGTDSSIAGNMLGFNAPNTSTFVEFTNQPTDQTAISGTTATFTAGGDSDGKIPIGTTGLFNKSGDVAGVGAFVQFPNVLFQWYRNGTLIPGATTPSYTTPPLKPGDSAQYYAAIRALGLANWSNSVTASLTVIADTNKPTAYAAVYDENGLPVISVSFSKFMDLSTITNLANYSVSGGGASFSDLVVDTNDARHVQLKLNGEPTGPITLTLSGITDFSGNSPVSSTLNVAASELTNLDIGDFTVPDPAWPGYMWVDGAGNYTVKTEGSDIWNSLDGFNFSYETKTNDFDVAVRQVSFTKVSNWSKGGLMVREDLTAGSRNWNIVNDPTSADGINAIDGSGTGANTVECNTRPTPGVASQGWGTGPATVPAYPNAWVRLKRTGQMLAGYWSSNGVDWVQEGLTDWSTNAAGPMPATVYVGICCTAHNNDSVSATTLLYYNTSSFANYNSSFVPPVNTQAKLAASVSGGNISISWSPAGGTLQSSPTLGAGATWTPVGTANPATVPLSGGSAKFFRVGP